MGNGRRQTYPARQRRRRKAIFRQLVLLFLALAVAGLVGGGIWTLLNREKPEEPPKEPDAPAAGELPVPEQEIVEAPEPAQPVGLARETDKTVHLTGELGSEFAVFIDAETNEVLAEKGSTETIYPASMTKVMTLLVAAEHLPDRDAPFTMTQEIIDRHYRCGATITGYCRDETCALRELFYGAALRSAADATTALAITAAGTEGDFVALMQEKAGELGLSAQAHFTNTSGLFHKNHTCTPLDMAAIMRAAMANPFVRELFSTADYVTPPTPSAPEGLAFRNKFLDWFLEEQPEGAMITACKSGYVAQAQNCLVSFGENAEGRTFICVTAKAPKGEVVTHDHRYLYSTFGK